MAIVWYEIVEDRHCYCNDPLQFFTTFVYKAVATWTIVNMKIDRDLWNFRKAFDEKDKLKLAGK